MKHIFFTILVFNSLMVFSQRGKDGVGNIIVANTIVNVYTPLTANASAGNTTITVSSVAGFSIGDLVYIIQMQGASINAGKDSIFPDFNSSIPTNTTHGAITAYNNTGNFEFAQVNSIPNATSIGLDCGLQKSYSFLNKVQVIRVPRYITLLVSGAGFISCPTWNGSTGGVAVVEVQSNATLTALPSFNVMGKGFRGGAVPSVTLAYVGGGNKFGSVNRQEGGYKGESINGDTLRYQAYSGQHGRGAMANGGGGGCTHNAGGGGGSNGGNLAAYTGLGNPAPGFNLQWNLEFIGFAASVSSGGGRGGYTWSNSNQNVTTVAPGNGAWGGDARRNVGGYGGRPLDYSTGKLFIGGGGGAGHGNDNQAGAGGNGGGMVYMLCYGNLSGAGSIIADGANGVNSSPGCPNTDGGGGGGGGGTIILNVIGSTALSAVPALSANGGSGGNVVFNCPIPNSSAYGPGAGGGAGYIAATGAMPANSLGGGVNGILTGITNNISTGFPPNGATAGGSNGSATVSPSPTITTNNSTVCLNNAATLTATSGTSTINWYNNSAGGSAVGTGTLFVTSSYTAIGTYTLFAGACPGSYRQPIIITVIIGPTLTVNSATICSGQSAVLTASGATTYTWSTGPNTVSITASPTITSIYTVSGSIVGCSASQTATITVSPIGTISVNSPTVCNGITATLTSGAANSYTWSTGSNSQSVSVTPSVSTVYTINATSAGCNLTNTTIITVNANPTVSVGNATICSGLSGVLTASGAAGYSWSTGANTSSISVSPTITTTYTVTGTTGTCANTKTVSVNVNTTPTVSVNSQSICSGANAILTASGAVSYSWNTGAGTASISANPTITTIYTVSGTSSGCSSNITSTVSVVGQPTVTVNSPTICSGNTVAVNASGASSYSWSTGANTSSISVSPTITTVYTVTGTTGACADTKTVSVNVNTTPTVSVNSQSICSGANAILTASGAVSYSWSTGAGTASISANPTITTVYTVSGTSSGCSSNITSTVNVVAQPTVTVNSPTICSGNTVAVNASGASSYSWSTGANTASISVGPTITTVYTVTGTTGACADTKTTSVNVNTTPTVSVNSQSICSGANAILTASGAVSYSWSTGAGTASISANPTITTVYTVSGTSSGCSSNITSTVNVVAQPTVTVNSPTICSGNTVAVNASGASSYSWSTGAVTSSIIVTSTATTIYTVTGTNGGSCSNVNTSTVTVFPQPSVTLNANLFNICGAQSASIIATANGTYSWSTGATSNSITTAIAGVYNLTITNSCGSSVQSATVVSGAAPAFTINASSTVICSGQSIILNTAGSTGTFVWSNGSGNTPSISVNVPNIYTATLSNGCGLVTNSINVVAGPSTNFSLSSSASTICPGQSVTLTALGVGTFSWSTGSNNVSSITVSNTGVYTATLSNSCGTGTANINIINGTVPTVTIVPSANSFCNGQTVTLTANGSAISYSWTNGVSGAILTTTSPGVYTAVGTNSCGSNTDNYNVTLQNTPSVSINASKIVICPAETTTLIATGINGGVTYSWSSSPTNTSNVETVSSAGNYIVTYTNACGSSSANVNVAQSTLTPDFNFTPNGGTSPITINFNNISLNNNTNQWNFGNGQNSNNITGDNSQYTAVGIYTVTLLITNSDGCIASISKTLEVTEQGLGIIPEIITPNNDGKNDLFEIKGIDKYPNNELYIYNRWGNLVYKMKGYSNSWNGTPNYNHKSGSDKLAAGTYFYLLNLGDAENKVFKGFIELLY